MRNVHFLNSVDLNLGGVTRAVINLCRYFHRADEEVFLMTRTRMEHVEDWTSENSEKPTLIELPGKPYRTGMLTQEERRFFADWLEPGDIVHLHGVWDLSNHRIAQICRQQKVPYCISSHGMLDDWSMSQKWLKKRVFWYLFGRRYLGRAFAIHTTAAEEKRQVERWVQGTRVHVVPYIFEMDSFLNLPGVELASNALGLNKDEKIVLFLSRIHLKKGVELLVDAMHLVQQQLPSVRTLLVGPGDPGYIAKIKQQIQAKGLEGCVELVGPIHGDKKVSLYERADIFVLPTFQENFGFVLPEAMASGTPVITTKGVDIWRELEAGGAQVVDRTPEDFAQKIIEIMLDDEKRESLGAQGRKWVFEALDPLEVIKRFLAMYESSAGTARTD